MALSAEEVARLRAGADLSRHTHGVAIPDRRLIRSDEEGVTFSSKDYRARGKVEGWIKTMTLTADGFIRRFLIHVLPSGFTASGTTPFRPAAPRPPPPASPWP